MSIVIELAPEEEARLRARAARQGQDAAAYATAVLRQDMAVAASVLGEEQTESTLAEMLAKRVGRLRSPEPSDMAANSETEFGLIMDEKQRQGHV